MGPSLIYDKSFLESLTVDESVWLDNYFICNITPLFYVETLADLEKNQKGGKFCRKNEEIVIELARKAPVMSFCPNVYHQRLIIENLMGIEVQTNHHRPIINGAKYSSDATGKIAADLDHFPEELIMKQWKKGIFSDKERSIAREWKQSLLYTNFDELIKAALDLVPEGKKLSSIEDIRDFSVTYVKGKYKQLIYVALNFLDIPKHLHKRIIERWQSRWLTFREFAPYASYVLSVNIFFYLCLSKSFISKMRPSNLIDLTYLYYLPFSSIFVSNDNLHARIAPLFLESDQMFVKGQELKKDLDKINNYFSALPENIKERGIFQFASYPPAEIDTMVGFIHDRYLIPWREKAKTNEKDPKKPQQDPELIKKLNDIRKQGKPIDHQIITSDQADSLTLARSVPIKRGSWRLLPPEVEKN